MNGNDLGVAFTTTENRFLVPALSSNQNEILELRTSRDQMKYPPSTSFVPIGNLMDRQGVVDETGKTKIVTAEVDSSSPSPPIEVPRQKKKKSKAPPLKPEALDLSKIKSTDDLEKLGMDRLKSALMAVGAKCGGSLQERAARLFSLKGLQRKDFPMKIRAKTFVL
uniref:SDE2/SF3A3 SAP domain-containing protein n=1 Tax=Grammatophora oceanica TaxID=210454 RepID=A0A7S1V2T1_9STRA